jgi:hypothetical protein
MSHLLRRTMAQTFNLSPLFAVQISLQGFASAIQ